MGKPHDIHLWVPVHMGFIYGFKKDYFLIRYACSVEDCEETKLGYEEAEEV